MLLVGYATDALGAITRVFVENPALPETFVSDPGLPTAPGNQQLTLAELADKRTRVFTPVFGSTAAERSWRVATGQ